MKNNIALLVLLAVAAVPAIGQNKKSMAIEPFDYSTVQTQVQAIFGTQMDIGRGISALLVKRVTQDGKFTVVERNRVTDIIKEQDFGASGRVKKGTQARIGQIRGADFTMMGDIVAFGRDDRKKSAFGAAGVPGAGGVAGGYKKEDKAVVVLNFRLVDSETSEVVMTGEARGESKRISKGGFAGLLLPGFFAGGGFDMSARNFSETIIGEAVMDAADKLAQQIANQAGTVSSSRSTEISGSVAGVEGNQVYLNVGSSSGVQTGDVFSLEQVIREVRDPATKEVLDVMTKPLGTMTITTVREKIAIGSFTGPTMPKPGDRAEKR